MMANELLTTQDMARADSLAEQAGTPTLVLMERAGRAVADAAVKLTSVGAMILVVCGPGKNGGDGFVAARVLAGRGYPVSLILLGGRDRLQGDASAMADRWEGPIGQIGDFEPTQADLIIDALFGAGLTRPLDGEAADLVRAMNHSGKPILSVDIPSGIDGNTGQICGVAVQAQTTVTFFRLKPANIYSIRAGR